MKNNYCSACLQERSEREFSVWAEDKSQHHICDYCIESIEDHNNQIEDEKARKILERNE